MTNRLAPLLFAALSIYPLAHAKSFDFNSIRSLEPSNSTQADVLRKVGKPSRIREPDQAWDYSEKGRGIRFSVFFEKADKKVNSWYWSVLEGDAEADIKTALSRFPGAEWHVDTEKWAPPDSEPMECFIRDPKKGVEIRYRRPHKDVSAIWVWNPSRAVASEEGAPPMYCFGKKCSPAKLTKDVFKNDPPMCELPK